MTRVTSAMRVGASETADAAGLPAQRAVTRGPDGSLWAVFPDAAGGSLHCLHSNDDGERWEAASQSETLAPVYNASLTIDEAGYADLVYAGEGPEYLYYRKGDPVGDAPGSGDGRARAGGWRWSIRVRIFDVPLLTSANAVAHAEQDEWKVHVVWSRGGEFSSAYYNSFKIDPEREIWLGTRERIAGPFDHPGHPAPSLDIDRETKRLWAAMWGGSQGVAVTEATYYGGRWKWSAAKPLANGPQPVHEGSVSAVFAAGALTVTYASDDELVCGTTAGREVRAAGPARRTSVGADASGRIHVLYTSLETGPLYHRVLAGAELGEAEEVHPGPVTSFSCEQHGAEGVGVLVAAGEGPPYSIEFLSVK